ncbi:hypothetical protein MVEG_10972 [Podila verticillata NRRL 6337]|nr:hypothetical protein MVEG_10972 [Podila verticillata NRRL 6337]
MTPHDATTITSDLPPTNSFILSDNASHIDTDADVGADGSFMGITRKDIDDEFQQLIVELARKALPVTFSGIETSMPSLSTPTLTASTPASTAATASTPISTTSTPTSTASTLISTTSTPTSIASTPTSIASTPTSIASTPTSTTSTPILTASTPALTASIPASTASTVASTVSTPSFVADAPRNSLDQSSAISNLLSAIADPDTLDNTITDTFDDALDDTFNNTSNDALDNAPDDTANSLVLTPAQKLGLMKEQRRNEMEQQHLMLQSIKDSLFADPFLEQSATALQIPEDQRITIDNKGRLVFVLQRTLFADWLDRHEVNIGTKFTFHGGPNTLSSGMVNQVLDCSCRGQHETYRGKTPGGKKGNHCPGAIGSIACKCTSAIKVERYPAHINLKVNGIKYIYEEPVTCVRYKYQHNHELGNSSNIGTLQKLKAICGRIKAMVQSGIAISVIMRKLTIEHATLTHLLQSGGKERLSRDNFITYDDVYNIYYALREKELRKDNQDRVSAALWMQDLEARGFFTYYDEKDGLSHGFSTPWQLEQFRKWGNVFCFDGTHHACG